ncbi:MAG: thioether cross-link-forming SCIFF peptide maturase [Eubacterium sp.]|nr:thioether cross-link-forming SCIFF peptide maturase [Eubacterium sp.]
MRNIHKFVYDDNNILLDINSGGIHLADKLTFEMIDYLSLPLSDTCPDSIFKLFPDFGRLEIKDCYNEIYQLFLEGALFADDDYERYAKADPDVPLKALCLHVAHDCNLKCEYCFAGTGDFGGERSVMEPETAKKAIDFLVENSGSRELLEIDFFGGEPLMAWDTVTAAVEYARGLEGKSGKRFSFTITTNGLLLDDKKIEYINNEMTNVVLSMDGRQKVNDLMRKTISGGGSYDLIEPKYKKLVENRKKPGRTEYYIRGTYTKNNLDFCKDILAINDAGFKEISLEPVIVNEKLPFAITEKDIPRIKDEYDRLYNIMKKSRYGFNFFHFNIDLKQGPCVIKRLRGCGNGSEYAAVTPKGDIYPCHQFVGIDQWKMGNIKSDCRLDPKIKKRLQNTHIYSKDGCVECWARFYCSGGCNATSFIYCGDIKIPHKLSCELMKKRIECAIALYVSRSLQDEAAWITEA